jgi:diacylglycerol kinase family enzyme
MLEIAAAQEQRQPTAYPEVLNVIHSDETKVAVLLNRNARLVTDKLVRKIERLVGRDHVYYSRTLEEAEAFTREIIQKNYGTIACGGGDGTLTGTVNFVRKYINEANRWRVERYERFGEKQDLIGMPRFAFLRLGTGNGIGLVVGAQSPYQDLRKLIEYLPGRNHHMPMMDADGEQCFVAGFGYDSMLLNDYNQLKQTTNNPILKPMMHSVLGYLAATVAKTVPRALFGDARLEARVVSVGKGYYVDPRRGDAVVEIEPGTTIYNGPASFIGAGTQPYFGYRFRAFPFSNIMPGMMNLRIATLGPLSTLFHLPKIWKGDYRNAKRMMDFLVEDVRIELKDPYPFQHSGDAQGMKKEMRLSVAQSPLKLVDFHTPRMIS